MQKCKIISIKSVGKQKTYNVTMSGNQHNYKIVDENGNGIYTRNSHSAAYAFIAYQTAWLKYYYPIEYMCNLLTSEIDNTDKDEKLDLYIKTADRMDIKLWKAHINRSGHEFIIDKVEGKEVLRAPLTALKGVGNKAVDSIVKGQPYKDFEDFMRRTEARVVNTRVFATIVEAGCMDEAWGVPRKLLLSQHGELRKRLEKEKKDKAKQDKQNAMLRGTSLFNEFNGIVEEEESSSSETVINENIRD